MLDARSLQILRQVPPGLEGACTTADIIAKQAGVPLPEARDVLRALFAGGYVMTDIDAFDGDPYRVFYCSPTGDRENGYYIAVERLPGGRFLVEEPPDPDEDFAAPGWAEFDTEAEAMAHAEKLRSLYYSNTLIVRLPDPDGEDTR